MSKKAWIFIGIAVLAIVVVVIMVNQYNRTRTPQVETVQYTKETTGLAGAGGIGGLGSLFAGLGLSDERYKKNISLTGYGVAANKIDTITPMEYMFTRADGTRPCPTCDQRMKHGFSAQQLEKVDPNLVHTDEDGTKYVDYHQIAALNTGAIKDMMADMAYLKGLVSSDAVQGGGPTNNRVL